MNKAGMNFFHVIMTLSGVLAGFQAYIMSRSSIGVVLFIIIPILFYVTSRWWMKSYVQKKKWSIKLRIIFIIFHFIPLFLQLSSVVAPNIDNIILGCFGCLLYYVTKQ